MQFQLFASNIEGNISHQKLRNCWVAKKLMGYTNFEFLEENFSETIWCIGLKFSEITDTALSIFRVFILLASSDSVKHMLMRHWSVNKNSPIQAGLFIVHVRIGPEEKTVLNKLYKCY